MSEPSFTVILPTYNRPDLLAEAVASVLAQTDPDFELIIVDDCGPAAAAVESDDSRIRIIRHERNLGVAAARNTGMRAARGRWITFLDDDDWFTPERLAIARRGLTAAALSVCWRVSDKDPRVQDSRMLQGDVSAEIGRYINPLLGVTAVEAAIAMEFDESFRSCQDVDWWIRMAQMHPVSTVAEVGLVMRSHAGERFGNGERQRSIDSVRLLRKHPEYFSGNRQAAAFRWKRAALMSGSRRRAVWALGHSFLCRPSLKTLGHIGYQLVVPDAGRRLRTRG